MKNAELKDCKFRETLTHNGDGNPEPSPENREGAETIIRLCVLCGEHISLVRSKQAKYCSNVCKLKMNRIKRVLLNGGKPGVGSGGNQFGEKNSQWINGKIAFRRIGREAHGEVCNRCKSTSYLVVHHINENRDDNRKENLEVLCKACHQNHHAIRDALTGRYISKNT
jgi:hypothetical protein